MAVRETLLAKAAPKRLRVREESVGRTEEKTICFTRIDPGKNKRGKEVNERLRGSNYLGQRRCYTYKEMA